MQINNGPWRSIALGGILLFGSIAYFVTAQPSTSAPEAQRISTYTAPVVKGIPIIASEQRVDIYSNGTLNAHKVSRVNARLSGYIESITDNLRLGHHVQKGELLFSLNDIDARLALSQAKLSLADATTRIAEEKVRYKQANRDIAAVSRPSLASDFAKRIPQLAAANADYNAKKIALEKARADLENTKISAPFNGVILASNVNKAEFINTDTSLFTLADDSVLEIQLPISFDQWRLINPDNIIHQEVELHIEELNNKRVTGQVSSIVPEVDSATGSLMLIVHVNNKHSKIPFGTYAKAKFSGKPLQNVIWLPQSALINDHEIWGVADNNTLGRVAIEILQYHEEKVLVRYQKPSFALRYFVEKSQFRFINQQVVTLSKS